MVDDIYVLHQRLKQRYPDVPLCIMGHSMGSFLTRTYLIRYPGTVKAAVIMGTGWQPRAAITGGLALANAIAAVSGENATSELVTELAFGSYNKLFAPTARRWTGSPPTRATWTTTSPTPLRRGRHGGPVPPDAARHTLQPAAEPSAADGQGNAGAVRSRRQGPGGQLRQGVRQTYDAFRAAGMRDCTLKLYPGLRHEILNEKAYTADITKNIEAWLLSRLEK